jgi:hypothetical protein
VTWHTVGHDSVLDDNDQVSISESLGPEAREWVWERGRSYHTFQAEKNFILPNDEREQEAQNRESSSESIIPRIQLIVRIEIYYAMMLAMNDALITAPISTKGAKILDWALEPASRRWKLQMITPRQQWKDSICLPFSHNSFLRTSYTESMVWTLGVGACRENSS